MSAAEDKLRGEWPKTVKLTDLTSYMTDRERGRLLELWNGAIQSQVDVRAQIREKAHRELLIAELERLGYTVTPPPDPRHDQMCPRCGQMCVYDGWDHVHRDGLGIGSCPAPPFRI